MKNIHILPTDKPSRLIHNDANQLCYQSNKSFKNDRKWMYRKKFNIYITNSEEIKEGDYCISHLNIIDEGKIHNSQTIFNPKTKEHLILLQSCKKIILTTDTDLIKDGVQTIDDEFLEWFVKNPSCEEVETYSLGIKNEETGESCHYQYEIIIPKEEPKQEKLTYTESAKKEERISNSIMMKRKKETLEEDDLKIPSKFCIPHKHYISDDDKICYETGYKDGIKWQMDKQSDFIIGFLEFIEGTYSYSNIYDHWYLHADTSKTYSKKQLLEVYLKRNKL